MFNSLIKFKLIKRTKTGRDTRGQILYEETSRDVYGSPIAITRQEYFTAGQIGIEPEQALLISSFDYKGEQLAEINGQKFRVYRTYPRNANELEIYCTFASGANGGA